MERSDCLIMPQTALVQCIAELQSVQGPRVSLETGTEGVCSGSLRASDQISDLLTGQDMRSVDVPVMSACYAVVVA